MGAYSTLIYSKSKAKERLLQALEDDEIEVADMERMMDILLDRALYNCRIVSDTFAEDISDCIK